MARRAKAPLTAYRIADRRHPIFDGAGAAQHGGRWNSPGRPLIYASETFAGALLEQLARANIGALPRTQQWISIDCPAAVAMEAITSADVPDWDARADYTASRAFGDAWLAAGRTAVLIVPSVVGRPVERNVLINPRHADFRLITASAPMDVEWDERLTT